MSLVDWKCPEELQPSFRAMTGCSLPNEVFVVCYEVAGISLAIAGEIVSSQYVGRDWIVQNLSTRAKESS